MPDPQFKPSDENDTSVAERVLGRFEAQADNPQIGDENYVEDVAHLAVNQNAQVSGEYIRPYKSPYTTEYSEGREDFQVGSVVMPVPPSDISVRRLRDVVTLPTIRGQAIPGKEGEGVVSIEISFDIPDFTDLPGPVNPLAALIAELKTCPFTVLRNRGLSGKIAQNDLFTVPEITQESLANIRINESARYKIEQLLSPFTNPVSQFGTPINPEWQKKLRQRLDRELARIVARPSRYTVPERLNEKVLDDGRENDDVIEDDIQKIINTLHNIFSSAEDDATFGRSAFGNRLWTSWEDKWESENFQSELRGALAEFIQSAKVQQDINRRAKEGVEKDRYKTPPKFIPVAFQSMALQTVKNHPGRARVTLTFELFNHQVYVNKLQWHSFKGNPNRPLEGTWGYTDDPANADLLLRWRDYQFLDNDEMDKVRGFVSFKDINLNRLNRAEKVKSEAIYTGDEVPGYFKYMRAAWRNRRCRVPSYDPEDHKLEIFYPENVPQIHSALPQPRGGFYNELVVDSGTHPQIDNEDNNAGGGIVDAVQVVWETNMSRQIDELTGLVTHQYSGGGRLRARFNICVPVENKERPRDEVLIGQINRMYNTLDKNRRLLPSEGFMPTTLFIKNPITELFGAYCFEATDAPTHQSSPGKVDLAMDFVESIPVVGLGEQVKTERRVPVDEMYKIMWALAYLQDHRRRTIDSESAQRLLNICMKIPKPDPLSFDIRNAASNFGFDFSFPNLDRVGDFYIAMYNQGIIDANQLAQLAEYDRNYATLEEQQVRLRELQEKRALYGKEYAEKKELTHVLGRIAQITGNYELLLERFGARFNTPRITNNASDTWVELFPRVFRLVIMNFLITGRRITSGFKLPLDPDKSDTGYSDFADPASMLEDMLHRLVSGRDDDDPFTRAEVVRETFFEPVDDFKQRGARFVQEAIERADDVSSRERLFDAMRDLGVLPPIAAEEYVNRLIEGSVDTNLDLATRPVTAQLYPDMVLPTYAEIFDFNFVNHTEEDLPLSHALRFIPSFNEYGMVRREREQGIRAARSLRDIADPDIWFYREVPEIPLILDNVDDVYFRQPNTDTVRGGNRTPTVETNQDGTKIRRQRAVDYEDQTIGGRVTRDAVLGQHNLEETIRTNRRRLLYAFPTYSLEFYIEGTQLNPSFQSDKLPFHWEGRLINSLPVIKMDTFEDTVRPNISEITFIARKAALRNEGWTWLPPMLPTDTETFTNDPQRVQEYLASKHSIQSDPNFITKLATRPGSRVTVRMGYGTDLNNTSMLPVKIAGTIGEISLGEVSKMVIQSIGTQLLNPVTATIGGSGWWSPNRIWDGRYTMRAFTDIFQSLDTRYMGRSGRGLENDLVSMTDQEIARLWRIGASTRSTAELIGSQVGEYFRDEQVSIPWALGLIGPAVPFTVAGAKLLLGEEASKNIGSLVNDPADRFYPELVNIYPQVSGVSDWAISNTDAMSMPGVYWVDMLSRLNPGSCWWPHPYGNEVRLFFGRPDQLYRESPLPIKGEDLSAAILTETRKNTGTVREAAVDLWNLDSKYRKKRYFFRRNLTGDSNLSLTELLQKGSGQKIEYYNGEGQTISETDWDSIQYRSGEEIIEEEVSRAFADFKNSTIRQVLPTERESLEIYRNVRAELSDETTGNLCRYLLVYAASEFETVRLTNDIDSTLDDAFRNAGGKEASHRRLYRNGLSYEVQSFLVNNIYDVFPNGLSEFSDFLEQLLATNIPEDSTSLEGGFLGLGDDQVITGDDDDPVQLPIDMDPDHANYMLFRLREIMPALSLLLTTAGGDGGVILTFLQQRLEQTSNLARLKYAMGYRRFRRYHYAISGVNLLSNRMVVGQSNNFCNAVQVDGYVVGYNVVPEERRVCDLDSDVDNLNFGIFQWFKGLLGENDRDHVLEILVPNALARGMSHMYDGTIELRGDPSIKPHDVVYVMDLHNGVYGPVKVKSAIHTFDADHGYVTRIVPELLTQSFSSKVLTEHVAGQRTLKTTGALALAAGVVGFAFGGPVGAAVGATAAIGAAGLFAYADIRDSVGRSALQNFSFADAMAQSKSKRDFQRVLNSMLIDTYIASNDVNVVAPVYNDQMMKKMTNLDQPELGVTVFPLTRMGTGTPLVAGMRSSGLLDIDPSITGVIDEATTKRVEEAIESFRYIIRGQITDVSNGANAVANQLKKTIDRRERNREALAKRLRSSGIDIGE